MNAIPRSRLGRKELPCAFTGALSAFVLLFFVSLIPFNTAFAVGTGILKGQIFDYTTGKVIPEATIQIEGTKLKTVADAQGNFQIELSAGKHGISIVKDEYYNTRYQVEIEAGKVTTYRCELVPGDPKQQFFFSIGGITVVDKRDVLPSQIETTHEISSSEIEHYLSTNLGDILDLVPGVERAKTPGLSKQSEAELRGVSVITDTQDKTAALFGTKIMIDGITVSNNANLQRGTGTAYGQTSSSTGIGVDLRVIPADNISKVEVVTGVPSVEYGDMTTGLVKVKTKIGAQPNRLKIKSNPDTKEGNLSGGVNLFNTGISYNANIGYSERNIRRQGDEYWRYSGQVTFDNVLLDKKLTLLNKFYYTGVSDETSQKKDDPLAVKQYNKDWTGIYGHSIEYQLGKNSRLEWNANVNYTKRDSYYQQLTGADVRVLTAAMQTGTYEGVYQAGAYLSRTWTKGEEVSIGAKLNFHRDANVLHINHALLAGAEYSFDDNIGAGKIFNPLFPPYGKLGSRPLPYSAAPSLQSASLYLEDEMSGFVFMRPYNVDLGVRYEMYTPTALHLDHLFTNKVVLDSKNGNFINPRIRLKYEPYNGSQVRLSWGKSSKMPSLSSIFEGPEYIDIVEENVSPPDSAPLISTYVFNYDTSRLKGYQESKTELSFDQKVGPVGLITTAYYSKADGIPRQITNPIVLYRYRWTEWPSTEGRTAIDTLYTEPGGSSGYYDYSGYFKSYGLEFQAVTKRVPKLSTTFHVTGSFVRTYSGGNGTYMLSPRINTKLGGRTIYPFYFYTEGWGQKMIVNYSADWFIKQLGMWVTFFVQQTLFDARDNYDKPNVYSTGYYDPVEKRYVALTRAGSDSLGLTRSYTALDLATHKSPNDRVLFNINVSKSLGRGAELSLFVNNIFDDPSLYLDDYGTWEQRNPRIFYGVEFSSILDRFWRPAPEQEGGPQK
jgi:hypothetical protein